jgi:hypothetical protein
MIEQKYGGRLVRGVHHDGCKNWFTVTLDGDVKFKSLSAYDARRYFDLLNEEIQMNTQAEEELYKEMAERGNNLYERC